MPERTYGTGEILVAMFIGFLLAVLLICAVGESALEKRRHRAPAGATGRCGMFGAGVPTAARSAPQADRSRTTVPATQGGGGAVIQLGQKVRDVVSGFTGIAESRTEWLNGCVRIGVAPPMKPDGTPQDAKVFDQEQLEVVDATPVSLPGRAPLAPKPTRPETLHRTRTGGGGRPDPVRR